MATVEDVLAAMERVVGLASPGPWEAIQLNVDDRTEPTERERIQGYVRDTINIGATDEYFAVLCQKPDGTADVCHTGNGPNSGWNAAYAAMFDPSTLTALLAVVKAAQARLNAGHNDGCMWVFDAERCDAKMDHSDHRPCDCGHDAVEKALAALTRPPQGAGG